MTCVRSRQFASLRLGHVALRPESALRMLRSSPVLPAGAGFLPDKIITQEWRLRHPKDASAASALDCDLRRATGLPGPRRTARSDYTAAVTGQRYGLGRRPAGAGELTGVRRGARRASARKGAAGRRPTVQGWPTALPPWAMVALGLLRSHAFSR